MEIAFDRASGTNATVKNPLAGAKFDGGLLPGGSESEGLRQRIDNNMRKPNDNEGFRRSSKPAVKTPRPPPQPINAARGHAANIFTKNFVTGPAATSPAELLPAPRPNTVTTTVGRPFAA
ncbi:MAG: hypothetical protein KDB22_01125 [Planctomycetales bacterium]|nr:hypothetical protein [Planctomycetales bacterium]MCA9177691.1 hypothetical protein [Planctomycetales bacterium]